MFQDKYGLTKDEVAEKFKENGLNTIPEIPPISNLVLFLSQLKSPLVYILLFAGGITVLLGNIPDAFIIFISVLVNTSLGYIQEKKANDSFSALKKLIVPKTLVIREGKRVEIETVNLVPGDLVILSQGTKIPSDGKIIEANRLYIDEAIITGENLPITKSVNDEIYMGTTIASGQALMEVTKTGGKTRIGAIAKEVQTVDENTPLREQLINFSQKLVLIIIALVVFIFAIGILRGNSIRDMFTTSTALAVSSIPEGLLVSMTAVLAIGMQKILKRKGLVRKLVSAETLGGVTTICIDKTGTLTEGKMQVVSYHGEVDDIARQMLIANDLDDPIVIAAHEWAKTMLKTVPQAKRLDSIPFSPKVKFSITLNKASEKENIMFVNGAPDVLLSMTNLTPKEKLVIEKQINTLTSGGRRLMGLARKSVSNKKTTLSHADATNLEWVGLIAFFDPVRASVKDALEASLKAGIKIVVITGDYPKTAEFVLTEIGMPVSQHEVMTGKEIENLPKDDFYAKVGHIKLFARTSPDQKQLIVEALQQKGEIVAMMGDGVNDAQAIHKANIGIVVDGASDVAKESADLILLDSNFSTIVAAIEEGRGIFDNIRKVILYLISGAFAEIFIVIGSIILDLPLPITAMQIVWINLVTDGFPGLALTVDPRRKGIMHEHPRSPNEKLINRWTASLVAIVTICAGGISLLSFIITYNATANLELARSMAFITVGLGSLTYVFSVRSLYVPFWQDHLFSNKWLLASVATGFILLVVPFLTSTTRTFFRVSELNIYYWLTAIGISIGIFFAVEVFKVIWHRNNRLVSY